MSEAEWSPISHVKAIFTEEIQAANGKVYDCIDDDSRLFMRSILPWASEVAPQDRLFGGIALRASQNDLAVCPYIFRVMCSNGAILAHALDTYQIAQINMMSQTEIKSALCAAIVQCRQEDLFEAAVNQLHHAQHVPAHNFLNIMTHLSTLPRDVAAGLINGLSHHWMAGGDRSRFRFNERGHGGSARYIDPEARWRLEVLGGQIGVPMPLIRIPVNQLSVGCGVGAGLRPARPIPNEECSPGFRVMGGKLLSDGVRVSATDELVSVS
jgi:hypothetical protein